MIGILGKSRIKFVYRFFLWQINSWDPGYIMQWLTLEAWESSPLMLISWFWRVSFLKCSFSMVKGWLWYSSISWWVVTRASSRLSWDQQAWQSRKKERINCKWSILHFSLNLNNRWRTWTHYLNIHNSQTKNWSIWTKLLINQFWIKSVYIVFILNKYNEWACYHKTLKQNNYSNLIYSLTLTFLNYC